MENYELLCISYKSTFIIPEKRILIWFFMTLWAENRLHELIKPDEMVLWDGQPSARAAFIKGFAIYFFAIPWCSLSFFMFGLAATPLLDWLFKLNIIEDNNETIIFVSILVMLFLSIFVISGLVMLATPLINYYDAKNTRYVITSKSLMIIKLGRSTKIKSYGLETLRNEFEIIKKRNNSGSIFFKKERYEDSEGHTNTERIGFENIENVTSVHEKMLNAQKAREVFIDRENRQKID